MIDISSKVKILKSCRYKGLIGKVGRIIDINYLGFRYLVTFKSRYGNFIYPDVGLNYWEVKEVKKQKRISKNWTIKR